MMRMGWERPAPRLWGPLRVLGWALLGLGGLPFHAVGLGMASKYPHAPTHTPPLPAPLFNYACSLPPFFLPLTVHPL